MSVQDSGLTTAFDINEGKLACFLKRIEAGYRDNPYHNRQVRHLGREFVFRKDPSWRERFSGLIPFQSSLQPSSMSNSCSSDVVTGVAKICAQAASASTIRFSMSHGDLEIILRINLMPVTSCQAVMSLMDALRCCGSSFTPSSNCPPNGSVEEHHHTMHALLCWIKYSRSTISVGMMDRDMSRA